MEREKIVYYYPMTEQMNHERGMAAAKRRWYQEASLEAWAPGRPGDEITGQEYGAGMEESKPDGQSSGAACRRNESDKQSGEAADWKSRTDRQSGEAACRAHWSDVQSMGIRRYGDMHTAYPAEFDVIGCPVPPFYYRHKPWKPEILSEAMENVLHRIEGMADAWLHPQIGEMLTEQYNRCWEPRRDTMRMVVKRLTEQYAAGVISRSGEAVVLLGKPEDTDWQMEMTRELLLPYLPRINRLLIFYEEIAETDIWMELGNHLDEYYYEYGLVPQLEPYVWSYGGRTTDFYGIPDTRNRLVTCGQPDMGSGMEMQREVDEGNNIAVQTEPEKQQDTLKCGKTKCCGLILDYCEDFRYPKIMPGSSAVYLDVMSASGKERLLGRKTPRIPYISPLKHLDTMVKSSYYRKI